MAVQKVIGGIAIGDTGGKSEKESSIGKANGRGKGRPLEVPKSDGSQSKGTSNKK